MLCQGEAQGGMDSRTYGVHDMAGCRAGSNQSRVKATRVCWFWR